MRAPHWLLALAMLAAACRGEKSSELATDLPPALEWTRGANAPTLLDASSGGTVVGQGRSIALYGPGDTYLVDPWLTVNLDGPGAPVVVLSSTRAILAPVGWPQAPNSALVVDLTGGSPPRTWTVELSPGSRPLVSDGEWLLASYPGIFNDPPGLELVNLDHPERRFTHRAGSGDTRAAVAAQGKLLVFLHEGWVRVIPELAPAEGWVEERLEPALEEVVEAVVEGDEVVIANAVRGETAETTPRLRVGRYTLADGAPVMPASKSIEVDLPIGSPNYGARFAWDGHGTGMVGGMEWQYSCRDLPESCLAMATTAYLIEEEPGGFRARPALLPYLELDDWAFPLTETRTMALRDRRLLALRGGGDPTQPYELAWYRLDGTATRLCEGDVTITSARELADFRARGCTGLTGALTILADDLEEVSLPDLAVAGHVCMRGSARLQSIHLPALTAVAGNAQGRWSDACEGLNIYNNARVERLDLPSLVSVSRRFTVEGNGALGALTAPVLAWVGGLRVVGNPLLPFCLVAALVADLRTAGWSGEAVVAGNGTSPACPEVGLCQGVTIATAEDWAGLVESGCAEVMGDLTVSTAGATELPPATSIRIVDGRLSITGNGALASFSMPALTRVGDLQIGWNAALRTVQLPVLANPGTVDIDANPALVELALPALVDPVRVWVQGNDALTRLDLPAMGSGGLILRENRVLAEASAPRLVASGGVWVAWNAALARLDLGSLASSESFEVTENPVLAELDLPAMVDLGYATVSLNAALARLLLPSATMGDRLVVYHNPLLGGLALPKLASLGDRNQIGGLVVVGNAALGSLQAPALTASDEVTVWDNPALPALELPLLASARSIQVFANDALGAFSAPSLRDMPGCAPVATSSSISVAGAALVELDLPALRSVCRLEVGETRHLVALRLPALTWLYDLAITRNDALAQVDLPGLTAVLSRLTITDNPLLPQCWAEGLLDGLLQRPPTDFVHIEGNDTTATCEP